MICMKTMETASYWLKGLVKVKLEKHSPFNAECYYKRMVWHNTQTGWSQEVFLDGTMRQIEFFFSSLSSKSSRKYFWKDEMLKVVTTLLILKKILHCFWSVREVIMWKKFWEKVSWQSGGKNLLYEDEFAASASYLVQVFLLPKRYRD